MVGHLPSSGIPLYPFSGFHLILAAADRHRSVWHFNPHLQSTLVSEPSKGRAAQCLGEKISALCVDAIIGTGIIFFRLCVVELFVLRRSWSLNTILVHGLRESAMVGRPRLDRRAIARRAPFLVFIYAGPAFTPKCVLASVIEVCIFRRRQRRDAETHGRLALGRS